jgi:hypothetical protein
MEPSEKDELSDQELDAFLPAWKTPPAPARLRAAVFPEASKPWWRTLWSASFRVPVPVACCLAIMLAFVAWRWFTPGAPRVVIQTERVEVPVVKKEILTKTVYRNRIVYAPAPTAGSNVHELQPVAELRPRILRSRNAQN